LFSKAPAVVNAPAPAKPALSLAAFERIMEQLAPTPKFVKYARPALPPGVFPDVLPAVTRGDLVLAMDANGIRETERTMAYDDGGTTAPTFSFLNSSALGCGLTFPGFPYLAALQQISEYRAPCEVMSTEMTREWIEIVSKGGATKAPDGDDKDKGDKPKVTGDAAPPPPGDDEPAEGDEVVDPTEEKIKEITDRMDELKLRERFQTVALYDGQFGGGHLYWEFKGADNDKVRQTPLVIEQIKKGTLMRVTAIEPYWMTPYNYNANRPELPDFYVPQSWFMLGKKTHTTRLMVVISRPLPDLLKPSYNFTGISLAQLMAPYIDRWLRTAKSVNDLISIFSIVNLSTDMQSTVQEGGDNGPTLLQRIKMFTASRDNKGVFITNKDSEELKTLQVSLASLDKLQAQSQEHMSAPSHIPLVKLFGITPTGLGATTEGEFQAFYDWVNAQQQHTFGDHIKRALEIVQMDLYGEVDPDITFKFKTLFKPTAKENAEVLKAEAERDDKYVAMGAISPDEVRTRLAGDPNSGYDGLTGDAPGPPIDPNSGIDPETGEPMAPPLDPNKDADREHASAEADKDRQHGAKESDADRKAAAKTAKAKGPPK
jgi:hypothetical protein